jgi:hypothetical protein
MTAPVPMQPIPMQPIPADLTGQPLTGWLADVEAFSWGSVQTGSWVIAGLFGLLILWLLLVPKRLLGSPTAEAASGAPQILSWLTSARFWAIVVAFIQLLVYLFFSSWR